MSLTAGCLEYEGDAPGECTDGADNDRDLDFDCADSGCAGAPACTGDDDDVGDDDDATSYARCTSSPATILSNPSAHTDDLIIGSIFDRSDFGIMARAVRLAVIQVNDLNGLAGRPVGIIECTNQEAVALDNLTAAEATVEVGTYMVEEFDVPVILGPATSWRAEVAFDALSPLGTLLISPSATSPALIDIDGTTSTDAEPGLFWRTAPPDSIQAQVIAQQMIDTPGARQVAVISQSGAYGERLTAEFVASFVGNGRTVDSFPFGNVTELAVAVGTVGDPVSDYDQVLMISSQTADAAAFLNVAAALPAYTTMGIHLTDAARNGQLLIDTAGTADALYPNVRGTSPATPGGPVYGAFSAGFSTLYAGEDPADFGFTAHAWDAAWLSLLGAAWADAQEDEISGTTIARGLRRISSGVARDLGPGDWTTALASFSAGSSIDVSGASGALDYDEQTGETTAPIIIWGINASGADFEDIDCVDPSDTGPLCP